MRVGGAALAGGRAITGHGTDAHQTDRVPDHSDNAVAIGPTAQLLETPDAESDGSAQGNPRHGAGSHLTHYFQACRLKFGKDRAQFANLKSQIDQDVRDALFDLQSATDQVTVARSNVDLASQTLDQARDRFSAGVTDNIEVVQAQDALASKRRFLELAERR